MGASKIYLKDAGQWIAANKSSHDSLFTNDQIVSFYATGEHKNRIRETSFKKVLRKIEKGQLNKFDLLAVQLDHKNFDKKPLLFKLMATKPLKIFSNRRGDSVFIFKS